MNRHQLPVNHPVSHAIKPIVETLEGRLFLSAAPVTAQNSATLRNGTLLVTGSDKADTIVMSLLPENGASLRVKINNLDPVDFAVADIKMIRAYGLGGSDKITVDELQGPISIRTYIFGGNGSDSLTSGSGRDTLIGGRGNDLLQSGAGNDWIEGNADADRILAGDGVDTINGGPRADTINSGAGKDRIIGQEKGDVVDTGAAFSMSASKKKHFSAGPIYKRLRKRRSPAAFNGTIPSTALTPDMVRKAYSFGDLSDSAFTNRGKGQTIAVVTAYHYPTAMADLNTFSDTFGLPRVNRKSFGVLYATGNQPDVNPAWANEAALDIQWAHAIAPLARIILVEADTDITGDLNRGIAQAVKALQPTGGVVSMSFEGAESVNDFSFSDLFRNSDTANVSFVAAAGNTGGEVAAPAVDPEVLAVGGTSLTVDGTGTRLDESAWVDGGGGESTVFDLPQYQQNLLVEGLPVGANRVVPDVAFNADPLTGVAVYSTTADTSGNTGWAQVGGTSAATPQWAGLVALVNEKRLANGLEVIGNGQLNNYIYGVARKYGPETFNDINTGDNTLHPATDGFDQATGWGTPKATALINRLSSSDSANLVSSRVNVSFNWKAKFRKDLYFNLIEKAQTDFTGRGTAKTSPNLADFKMDQGRTTDPVTGDPLPFPADQITFSADGLERIGNTIVGRGTASVVTFDGYAAEMLIKFTGRLYRLNGIDKIVGEFYAVSHRNRIIAQGKEAILRGEFNTNLKFNSPAQTFVP